MRARIGAAFVYAAVAAATVFAQPPGPSAPSTVRPVQPATAPRGGTPRASEQPPPPPPAPPVASTGTRRQGQPVNVKIEFTITDQRGTAAPVTRTVTVIVADAHTGMIRSQAEVTQVGSVPLNIDATPELLTDGKVRVGFNVQYDWPAPIQSGADAMTGVPREGAVPRGTVYRTSLHDSVSLILESGKPMIAAQSADPIGDRQVTVEVKATVLK